MNHKLLRDGSEQSRSDVQFVYVMYMSSYRCLKCVLWLKWTIYFALLTCNLERFPTNCVINIQHI